VAAGFEPSLQKPILPDEFAFKLARLAGTQGCGNTAGGLLVKKTSWWRNTWPASPI
jgi:hypothetical protein